MKISSLHDAYIVLEEAKTAVALGSRFESDPLLEALEWSIQTIEELEEVRSGLMNRLDAAQQDANNVTGRLKDLQEAVEKSLGYIRPTNSAWEILNDALGDSKR